jgi:hypothetical protein
MAPAPEPMAPTPAPEPEASEPSPYTDPWRPIGQ